MIMVNDYDDNYCDYNINLKILKMMTLVSDRNNNNKSCNEIILLILRMLLTDGNDDKFDLA